MHLVYNTECKPPSTNMVKVKISEVIPTQFLLNNRRL